MDKLHFDSLHSLQKLITGTAVVTLIEMEDYFAVSVVTAPFNQTFAGILPNDAPTWEMAKAHHWTILQNPIYGKMDPKKTPDKPVR